VAWLGIKPGAFWLIHTYYTQTCIHTAHMHYTHSHACMHTLARTQHTLHCTDTHTRAWAHTQTLYTSSHVHTQFYAHKHNWVICISTIYHLSRWIRLGWWYPVWNCSSKHFVCWAKNHFGCHQANFHLYTMLIFYWSYASGSSTDHCIAMDVFSWLIFVMWYYVYKWCICRYASTIFKITMH